MKRERQLKLPSPVCSSLLQRWLCSPLENKVRETRHGKEVPCADMQRTVLRRTALPPSAKVPIGLKEAQGGKAPGRNARPGNPLLSTELPAVLLVYGHASD